MTDDAAAGVILAGGLARRMGGGDKCLRNLAGRPVLSYIVERARSQVSDLALNANGDATRFVAFGLPVVSDVFPGFAGPLAGVLTGLEWAAQLDARPRWVASFAADAPFFPLDLVPRLLATADIEGADMACASSAGRPHPVFGLWPLRLRDDLRRAVAEGVRKVDAWTARYRVAIVDFGVGALDPFFNVNTPEDLAEAERLLERAA